MEMRVYKKQEANTRWLNWNNHWWRSGLTSNRCIVDMAIDQWNKSSSEDEIPERDVTSPICLLIYHWTTTHMYFRNIFWLTRTCYISNGRRFTKSALRIWLLSTFRVSSINYICSLPIHARSSAITQRDRKHTVSWNRVKCFDGLHFKRPATFKVIQGHCRCCHLIGHIRFPISLTL